MESKSCSSWKIFLHYSATERPFRLSDRLYFEHIAAMKASFTCSLLLDIESQLTKLSFSMAFCRYNEILSLPGKIALASALHDSV